MSEMTEDPVLGYQRPYIKTLLENSRQDAELAVQMLHQDSDLESAIASAIRETSIANGTMSTATAAAATMPGNAIEAERVILRAKKEALLANKLKILRLATLVKASFDEVETLLDATNRALEALPKPKMPKAVIDETPIAADWLKKGTPNDRPTDERNEALEGSENNV